MNVSIEYGMDWFSTFSTYFNYATDFRILARLLAAFDLRFDSSASF